MNYDVIIVGGGPAGLTAAIYAIRKRLNVLLVSEDLDEIFELCDRIAVMFRGEFVGVLDAEDPRLKDIGLMMAGTKL